MDIHTHKRGSAGYLREAEVLHKSITLYLWLSYRFGGVFVSQPLAFHVKGLLEAKIDECLSVVEWNEEVMRRQKAKMRKAVEKSAQMKILEEALQGTIGEEGRDSDSRPFMENMVSQESEHSRIPLTAELSPLKEDPGIFDGSSASEAGVPTPPDDQAPGVENSGPMWEVVAQEADATRDTLSDDAKP